MKLEFEKMHGIGTDFVVLAKPAMSFTLRPEEIRRIADRRFGIGCDQVLIAAEADGDDADVTMQIFNADGSSAKQCGNGIRCFAQFVRDRGIVANPSSIRVATPSGVVVADFLRDGRVRANLGPPDFNPAAIPMRVGAQRDSYPLRLDGEEFTIGAVSMGNPHAVIIVDDAESAPVSSAGPKIQTHDWFPDGVNVGFLQLLSRDRVRLRVFERGVGETLACGSGACAAVAVGVRRDLLDRCVRVDLNGGSLDIEWEDDQAPMWMTGPSTRVFQGEIEL
jgi:diaminopimelate epimerase